MHWYDTDGTPRYEVKKKDGGMRSTTLRDARKHGWVPSVTTVMDIVGKPGREAWKVGKAIESATIVDRRVGDTYEEHAKRILSHSKQESEKAAKRGVYIHGELETYFHDIRGKDHCPHPDSQSDIGKMCEATKFILDTNCGSQDWIAEDSFCHKSLGYGGKLDLHSDEWVIDFKTKEFSGTKSKQLAFDSMAYQLIAYSKGLPIRRDSSGVGYDLVSKMSDRRIANVFISADNPGHVVFHEWPEDKLEMYWHVFTSALKLWKYIKNYWPEEFQNERS